MALWQAVITFVSLCLSGHTSFITFHWVSSQTTPQWAINQITLISIHCFIKVRLMRARLIFHSSLPPLVYLSVQKRLWKLFELVHMNVEFSGEAEKTSVMLCCHQGEETQVVIMWAPLSCLEKQAADCYYYCEYATNLIWKHIQNTFSHLSKSLSYTLTRSLTGPFIM